MRKDTGIKTMPETKLNSLPSKAHANKSKATLALEEYIEATGKCPDCDLPMENHPKCEACNCLAGTGHENRLSEYRGHKLCGHCYLFWRRLEKRRGEEISWKQFTSPKSIQNYLEG